MPNMFLDSPRYVVTRVMYVHFYSEIFYYVHTIVKSEGELSNYFTHLNGHFPNKKPRTAASILLSHTVTYQQVPYRTFGYLPALF